MRPGQGRRAGNRLRLPGLVFIIIAMLLLMAALNTGNNLLFIVLGGVTSFVLMSVVLSSWSLRNVTLRRDAPYAVHRGEPFLIETRIENHKLSMPTIGLRVEAAGRDAESLGFIVKVPARRAAVLNIPYMLNRRGLHRIPAFRLATGFPFGLLEKRRRYDDELEVLVYPRIRAMRAAVVEKLPGPAGVARSAAADGEEYFSIREYLPGDEIRRIAWRISARLGVWMVREMSRQHSRFVIFALDTRWTPEVDRFPEHFEEVIEVVASLAVTLLKRQFNVGLVTPTGAVEGGEGVGQERRILEMLARLEPAPPEMDFETRLRKLESHEARLVCVSPDPALWGQRSTSGGQGRRVW